MTDLVALKAANERRWAVAKPTRNLTGIAKALVAAKPRYQTVSAKTGVPWFVIAVIHEREASQRWDTHLAQGDPLNEITRHVPVGEPAFKTWEEGAIDALVNCPPHLAQHRDWSSPGPALTAVEGYNGFGPEAHHIASGYLWAGTDQYTKGKYIRDGVWDSEFVDPQPGCAALIKYMMVLDPTITFTGTIITPLPVPPRPAPTPQPKPVPSLWSLVLSIVSIIAAIFKRDK